MNSYLYSAAVSGNVDAFRNFAQNGDHLPVDHAKNTVLHVHLISARVISSEFIHFIVEHFPQLILDTNIYRDSPFHIAARYGRSEVVGFLMAKARSDVLLMLRIRNDKGDTALHEAVRNKHEITVSLLLECQDDISDVLYGTNNLNESPVYIAASKGYYNIFRRLIDHQVGNMNPSDGAHALIGAVLNNNLEIIELILEMHPEWLAPAGHNLRWTPLHYAANGNDKRGFVIVQKFLQFNQYVAYFTDDMARTALHIAACRGHVQIMNIIMAKCSDCTQFADNKGWNVLHYAVISESDDALRLVINDPSFPQLVKERDVRGYTPLHLLTVSRDCLPSFLDVEYLRGLFSFEFPATIFNRLPIFRRKLLDDLIEPEELVLAWMNDVGEAPSGINRMVELNHFQKRKKQNEEEMADRLDRAKDYHLVVATLVATVTFAAAFTVPGGFVSDGNGTSRKGSPILMKNSAFKAFFIFDAIAMALSTSSVFVYIVMAILQNKKRYDWLMRSALRLIVLAMAAMVLAFVTGSYAILSDSLVYAACICAIALSFFIYVIYVTVKIIMDSLRLHQEYGPIYRSLLSMWRRSPFHFCK